MFLGSLPAMSVGSQLLSSGYDPASAGTARLLAEADGPMVMNGPNAQQVGRTAGGLTQLLQASEPKQAELVADDGDGLPALVLDGSDDNYQTADDLELSSFTYFLLFRYAGSGLKFLSVHGTHGYATPGFYLTTASGATFAAHRGGVNCYYDTSPTWANNTWRLTTLEYDGVAAMKMYENGVAVSPWTAVDSSDPGSGAVSGAFTLGGTYNDLDHTSMAFRVSAAFSPILSREAAAINEAYWVAKWGLSP